MNIRLAEKQDAPALVEFNQAMALETEGKMLDTQILRGGVESVFHDDKKGFYEWSDWRDGWFWWIQSVYILPEYRGRGIYRLLYEFVKNRAEEVGDVCGFRLYVEKENTGAQGVYEKLGMEKTYYLMYEEMI
jgi:ribosomal protein S18 acetylase RimI-like enzyme